MALSRVNQERKRILEIATVGVIIILLLGISRLETRMYLLSDTLSQHPEISTTVTYFALININVVLVLVLGFLIFRNVAKLVIERRRGILGSRLKTKLVVSLVFFALAPTLLLFYVSMRFVTTSFGEWFSDRVTEAMRQTRQAAAAIYEQDEKRMRSLANIALHRVQVADRDEFVDKPRERLSPKKLKGFQKEYAINSVTLYDNHGTTIWSSARGMGSEIPEVTSPYIVEVFSRFMTAKSLVAMTTLESEDRQDVVKGIAPIADPLTGELLGAVLVEERFQTQIFKSVEKILSDFSALRPGAQLIRLSYLILMVLMTLLITFAATWMGFYVARGITGPLQSLAEATREVALGNYSISLQPKNNDETGQLVRSFNHMTRDLEEQKQIATLTQSDLEMTNLELDQRRQYMEIVLRNIASGVISVDNSGHITSLNPSAERLLSISASHVIGKNAWKGLEGIVSNFWSIIYEALENRGSFQGTLDVLTQNGEISLNVDAARISDDSGVQVGYVVVIDDASEQARVQKVAAWREVARRIAHEIKNPITPIKLSAQRLLRRFNGKFEGSDREVFETCSETIIRQVDSLRDLVNEFSKFAKHPEIVLAAGDLNGLIREVVDLFHLSYPLVKIDLSRLGEIPEIPMDRPQLNRALLNIVTNSVAAMVESRPGEIQIRTEAVSELGIVRLEVADNGSGIPRSLKDRVLEPYFSTKDEGTGLGLAIVNQIVSDHGGYLRLTDNEPFGTVVVIELPAARVAGKLV